ncbi:MAG: hypothetical protein IT567_04475, partial [Alphaproteobacteria bacterium]|nr:hypothetical protein [Alphaproteobacteria bacterium]
TVLGAFSCFMFPQDRFLIRRAEERFAKPEERIAFYDALAEPMLRYMAESDPREELAKHLRNVPELAEIVLRALDAATTGPFRHVTLGDEGVRLIKSLARVHDLGKMFHRQGEIPFLPELGQDAGFVIRNQAHPEFSLRILSFPVDAMRKDALLAADHHLDGRPPFGSMPPEERLWLSQTITLSDMFEAMTGPRAFRKEEFRNGYSVFNALEFLRDAATRPTARDKASLDPQLVRFFVEERLYERYMDTHPELRLPGRLATPSECAKASAASETEALESLRDAILRAIPLDPAHTPQGRLDYTQGMHKQVG